MSKQRKYLWVNITAGKDPNAWVWWRAFWLLLKYDFFTVNWCKFLWQAQWKFKWTTDEEMNRIRNTRCK